MAAQPPKRSKTPDEQYDVETGMKILKPTSSEPIEIIVHKPVPISAQRRELTGEQILSKAIGPGAVASYKAGRKTRRHKRVLLKKTQKRRGRK